MHSQGSNNPELKVCGKDGQLVTTKGVREGIVLWMLEKTGYIAKNAENTVVLLSIGDTFQDPQWTPKATDNTKFHIYYGFLP